MLTAAHSSEKLNRSWKSPKLQGWADAAAVTLTDVTHTAVTLTAVTHTAVTFTVVTYSAATLTAVTHTAALVLVQRDSIAHVVRTVRAFGKS